MPPASGSPAHLGAGQGTSRRPSCLTNPAQLCSCFVRVPRPPKRPQPLGPPHRRHRPSVPGDRGAAGGRRPAGGPAASRGGDRRTLQNPERPTSDPALDPVAGCFPASRRTCRPRRRRPGVDPPPHYPAAADPPHAARAVSTSAPQIRLAGALGAGGSLPRLAVAASAGGAGDGSLAGRFAAGAATPAPALPDAGGRTAPSSPPRETAARSARSVRLRRGGPSAAIRASRRAAGRHLADRLDAADRSDSIRARLSMPAEVWRSRYDINLISLSPAGDVGPAIAKRSQ